MFDALSSSGAGQHVDGDLRMMARERGDDDDDCEQDCTCQSLIQRARGWILTTTEVMTSSDS